VKWPRVSGFFHSILKRMGGRGTKLNKEKWLACTSLLQFIYIMRGGDEPKCNWIRRAIIGQTLELCVALPTELEGLCK